MLNKIHPSTSGNLLLVASCSIRPDRTQTCSSSKTESQFGHKLKRKKYKTAKKQPHWHKAHSLYSLVTEGLICWRGDKAAQSRKQGWNTIVQEDEACDIPVFALWRTQSARGYGAVAKFCPGDTLKEQGCHRTS